MKLRSRRNPCATSPRGWLAVWGAVIGISVSLCCPGEVQGQIVFETIATSLGTAPETNGGVFESFENAKINAAGDLVFSGRLLQGQAGVGTSNDAGIWRQRSGQAMEKVARTGDTTSPFNTWGGDNSSNPPQAGQTPVVFRSLGEPAIGADGNVAYASRFVLNGASVYDWQDGGLWVTGEGTVTRPGEGTSAECWLVCRSGIEAFIGYAGSGNQTKTVNGESYGHRIFDTPHVGPSGTVTFSGLVIDWREIAPDEWREYRLEGLWVYERPAPGGGFDPAHDMSEPPFVAVEEVAAPGGSGAVFEEVQGGGSSSGVLAQFGGGLKTGQGGVTELTRDGLWRSVGGTTMAVATGGSSAPGTTGDFYRFGLPAMNASANSAFWASLLLPGSPSLPPPVREGVWLNRSGVMEPLALEGGAAPGVGGAMFSMFYDPILNEDGTAAFLAELAESAGSVDESNDKGIWRGGLADRLQLVVRSGGVPPGVPGAQFKAFSSPRLNRLGQLAFTAALERGSGGVTASSDHGCWAMGVDGQLQLVLRKGDIFAVGPGDMRTIVSMRLSDFSDGGMLLFWLGFADGSSGLVRATLPAPSILSYDQWAIDMIPDPAKRGKTLDLEGDGLSNFFEFAFGRNPLVFDSEGAPTLALLTVPGGAGGVSALLTATFERRIGGAAVDYETQVSSDLDTWTVVDEIVDVELTGDGMQRVTVRDMATAAGERRRFIRVVPKEL
jgi:hypothetical protein